MCYTQIQHEAAIHHELTDSINLNNFSYMHVALMHWPVEAEQDFNSIGLHGMVFNCFDTLGVIGLWV